MRSLALALTLVVVADAAATTRYVSKNGSDTNDGALAATIEKQRASRIPEGVYRQIVSVATNGTASAPITIAAYFGENAIVDDDGLVNGHGNPADVVMIGAYEGWKEH
jgi:hypothetical protein